MSDVPTPRAIVSDAIVATLATVLAQSHGVPDAVLLCDDGFTPEGRRIVDPARAAIAHICALAPYFGLSVQPNSAMLPLDPSLSRAQRALLRAVVAE